jgi:hypothetical protein
MQSWTPSARGYHLCASPQSATISYPIRLINFEALFFFEHIKKNVNESFADKKGFFL